jgi:predicted transcriptional regulator of viral defense system
LRTEEVVNVMRQLELVNALMAEGRESFTFEDARAVLGTSAPATANALHRLSQQGLVDRLSRGHYAIRPLGSLGTSTTTDDLGLAVAAAFEGREHRIGYLTALGELGLLTHPVRSVQVACTSQVRVAKVSRRQLRAIIERADTIHLGAERAGPSWRSGLERALFDCALRMDLAGGPERLAEAIASGGSDANPVKLLQIADAFGGRGFAAARRIASLAHVLQLPLPLAPLVGSRQPAIRLDPGDEHREWTDHKFRVTWNLSADELRAVIGQ